MLVLLVDVIKFVNFGFIIRQENLQKTRLTASTFEKGNNIFWIFFAGRKDKAKAGCQWSFDAISRAWFSWFSIVFGSWDSSSTE